MIRAMLGADKAAAMLRDPQGYKDVDTFKTLPNRPTFYSTQADTLVFFKHCDGKDPSNDLIVKRGEIVKPWTLKLTKFNAVKGASPPIEHCSISSTQARLDNFDVTGQRSLF